MKPSLVRLALLPLLLSVGLCTLSAGRASDEASLPKDVPSLVKLLRDKDTKVRASAADHLGKMREKAAAAVPALLLLLSDDGVITGYEPFMGTAPVPRVNDSVIRALQQIGPSALPEVTGALQNPDAKIRVAAVKVLAGTRSPPKDVLPALVRTLKDPKGAVRCSAVEALGSLGKAAKAALPAVITLAQNDLELEVRYYAIAAVSAIDSEGTQTIPVSIRALGDKDPNVRGEAARTLGDYGPRAKSAVAALTLGLADKEERARWISADFCMQRAVRYDMAEALGKIGPAAASALPKLRKMLQTDEDGEVHATVAQAVLRIDPRDKEALPALIKVLQDEDNGTGGPEEALAVLESLGPAAAVAIPAIKKSLGDQDSFVRRAAATALAAVAGKNAVPVLVEQMKSERRMAEKVRGSQQDDGENDSVCATIAAALGNFGPDAAPAVPVLSAIVADSQLFSFDKVDAVESLGKIGPAAKDAVPQLIEILDEKDGGLPRLAAVALGRIGPAAKAAVPRLLKLSDSDPNEDVQAAARAAVRRIAPDALTPHPAKR